MDIDKHEFVKDKSGKVYVVIERVNGRVMCSPVVDFDEVDVYSHIPNNKVSNLIEGIVSQAKVKATKVKEEEVINVTSEEYRLCTWFLSAKKKTHPKSRALRKPNLRLWYVEVKKAIEQSEVSINEIKKALEFSLVDDFWSEKVFALSGLNILSKNGNTKLQNLIASMKAENKQKAPDSKQSDRIAAAYNNKL